MTSWDKDETLQNKCMLRENNIPTIIAFRFPSDFKKQASGEEPKDKEKKVNGGVIRRKPRYCSGEGRTKRELIIVFKCLESYSRGNADQLFSIFIRDRTKGDALNYRMKDSIET